MTHRLDIPLDRIDEAFSAEFAAAYRLMKPGVKYRRTYAVSGDLFTVTWEEIPEVAQKPGPTLVVTRA